MELEVILLSEVTQSPEKKWEWFSSFVDASTKFPQLKGKPSIIIVIFLFVSKQLCSYNVNLIMGHRIDLSLIFKHCNYLIWKVCIHILE